MGYPMHATLKVGARFPDFTLPDQAEEPQTLSGLLGGMPGVLVFNRGSF